MRKRQLGMLACLIWTAGCASATSSTGGDLAGSDLSSTAEDLGVQPDLGMPDLSFPDLSVGDLSLPFDMTLVCDSDANMRRCDADDAGNPAACVSASQCCMSNECPPVDHGTPVCTSHHCGFGCDPGYKPCKGGCIPNANCCNDGDCTNPGDPCKLAAGATCNANGTCNYPPVVCSYTGQSCNAMGNCVCPAGQHVCQASGSCIPDGTCCTNADCSAVAGEVCPAPGGTCTCLSGFKACITGGFSQCILATSCCSTSDCTIAGQTCSGPGGSCMCPANQKVCGAQCIPSSNCCVDLDCSSTISGEICVAGACQCPSGQRVCNTFKTCINQGTCCIDSDCALSGQKCSGIGGSCSCPGATYACPASNSCIPNGTCCTNSNCTVTGQTCVGGPPGNCQCPGGTAVCTATNSCVSTAAGRCCTASDCPTGSSNHVSVANCGSTFCSVNTCQPGYVDVNGTWSDGCECQDDAWAKSCGTATALGQVHVGNSLSRTGVLPLAGEENWFQVTFPDAGGTNYHPHITISSGDAIKFDIYAGSCGSGALGCGNEGGGATFRTDWEVTSGGDSGAPGCGDTNGCNSCNCTSPYSPTPAVGSGGSVLIRVFRASGGPTCNSYTLTVSD